MMKHLFADLYELEAGNFWYRARNRLILWLIARYFPEARSFLEVGCGTGFVLAGVENKFPEMQCVGTELEGEGLKFAAKRVRKAKLLEADARSLPFESEFELAGTFDVLEHIADDEAAIAGIARALRPGGGLLVTVPQHPFLWSAHDEVSGHVRRYTAHEIRAKLERAGIEVLRIGSFLSLLFPVLVAARILQRGASAAGGAALSEAELRKRILADFRVSPPVNLVLGFLLWIEGFLFRLGVNFPFGGSVVVVARRDKVNLQK